MLDFRTKFDRSALAIDCCRLAFLDDQEQNFIDLGFDKVSFVEDRYTSTELYIASDEYNIVIVFRATKTWKDWITDIKARFSRTEFGKVHKGFSNAYYAVKYDLVQALREHQGSQIYKPIYVFGHSLGGALATVATTDLDDVEETITFGAPRSMGRKSSKRYDRQYGERTIRYSAAGDFITHLPPYLFNYRHVGVHHYFDMHGKLALSPSKWKVYSESALDLVSEIQDRELLKFEDHHLSLYETLLLQNGKP